MSRNHDVAPSWDAIQNVVKECGCSERRAIALLKANNNSFLKANEFYQSSKTIWHEIQPKPALKPASKPASKPAPIQKSPQNESNEASKLGVVFSGETPPPEGGPENQSPSLSPKNELPAPSIGIPSFRKPPASSFRNLPVPPDGEPPMPSEKNNICHPYIQTSTPLSDNNPVPAFFHSKPKPPLSTVTTTTSAGEVNEGESIIGLVITGLFSGLKANIDEVHSEIRIPDNTPRTPQKTTEKAPDRIFEARHPPSREPTRNPFEEDIAMIDLPWSLVLDYETEPPVVPKNSPTSCMICLDDFCATTTPPAWISLSCLHEPSVCSICLAKWIKSELENKIWNQITCPECKTLLVYEDVQRLADPGTFARYEVMSFRNAIGGDDNFVWCKNCPFGQLHKSGSEHPIVRCLKCGFRSCFRHDVPWHERITCKEYDEMLRDPENFRSAADKDDEAAAEALGQQHKADEQMARQLEAQDRQVEEDRQRTRHLEELGKAREAQKAEAGRKKKQKEEQGRAERAAEIRRKQMQEAANLRTISSTTKTCPGCRWPIEKNEGCAHMTCTQCKAEFCWDCLSDYNAIRVKGNSEHRPSCQWHTDNLPKLSEPLAMEI